METKQKRTKVKVILSIILPVLLVTGILAVSVYADKPPSPPGLSKKKPKPEPIKVSVTGDIIGVGDPATMAIHFSHIFGDEATLDNDGVPKVYSCTHEPCLDTECTHEPCPDEVIPLDGPHVQNPDRANPLRIGGTPKNKNFSYRYCDHHSHAGTTAKCDDLINHSPKYYKELDIYGGRLDKKTGTIVWPVGSDWRISWKQIMGTIATGVLDKDVTYEVLEWSTP